MRIDTSKFESIILASGLTHEAKKACVQVRGADGRRVYVPNGKTATRVYLSGFEHATLGVPAGKHAGGAVTQLLDWSGTEDEVLARFTELLAYLGTLPAVEKQARKAPTPKADAPKGFTAIKPDPEARKALIEKVAREKGVKVSAKANLNGTPAAQ